MGMRLIMSVNMWHNKAAELLRLTQRQATGRKYLPDARYEPSTTRACDVRRVWPRPLVQALAQPATGAALSSVCLASCMVEAITRSRGYASHDRRRGWGIGIETHAARIPTILSPLWRRGLGRQKQCWRRTLMQGVCDPTACAHRSQRVSTCLDWRERSIGSYDAARPTSGLCAGAPFGDGSLAGSAVASRRDRPSPQRRQVRQPHRESGIVDAPAAQRRASARRSLPGLPLLRAELKPQGGVGAWSCR